MKKNILILIAVILLVGAFVLVSCSAAPIAPTSPNEVSITVSSFDPGTITVSAGTTVNWVNNDNTTHNIKSATFNSPDLTPGQTYSFKFDTAGTYNYSCSFHPNMTGSVVVQ